MNAHLIFRINLEANKKLSEYQREKIHNAVYAAIESELESVRKGQMEDYNITAAIDNYSIYGSHHEGNLK